MATLIPPHLVELWRRLPDGDAALARLPLLIQECVEKWELELGGPFPQPVYGGGVGFVAPALLADGKPVVLKINFPDLDSEREADALRLAGGEGAVMLLADAAEGRALLLERLEPGASLWTLDELEANGLAAEVLRKFRRPVAEGHSFRLLAEVAAEWAEDIPRLHGELGRPFEQELADEAASLAAELAAASAGENVLLHQDFHQGNVLSSARGWLAIDPKPLVGDSAFDAASLLRDRRPELMGDAGRGGRIRRRFDQLAEALELDRARMRGWGIVHAVAWGIGPDYLLDEHIECARLIRAVTP